MTHFGKKIIRKSKRTHLNSKTTKAVRIEILYMGMQAQYSEDLYLMISEHPTFEHVCQFGTGSPRCLHYPLPLPPFKLSMADAACRRPLSFWLTCDIAMHFARVLCQCTHWFPFHGGLIIQCAFGLLFEVGCWSCPWQCAFLFPVIVCVQLLFFFQADIAGAVVLIC